MFASTNRTIIKKRLLHYLVVMLFTKAFPIEGYTSDSTAVVFNATSYFSCSNKDVLNLSGRSYGGMLTIVSASPQSKTSFVDSADAFDNCISITQNCTAKLSISIMGFVSKDNRN